MTQQATRAAGSRPVFRVHNPVTYNNLSIFVIDGADAGGFERLLTLEEAIERGVLVVHETASVNQLAVENVSAEFDVFIQCGDIVKGGMQDRVLSSSVIIPRRSGTVPLESFCVESGRWEARGAESVRRFSSSKERLSTKELKLAAMRSRSQSEVWREVSETQSKLAQMLRMSVADERSPSSLLLSLEHEAVRASADDYMAALAGAPDEYPKAVGFAFSVNGRVSGCDIFGSRKLFRKLWKKLLRAAVVEAMSESTHKDVRQATPASVRGFLRRAERGFRAERPTYGTCRIATVDSPDAFVTETADGETGTVVHRTFVRR